MLSGWEINVPFLKLKDPQEFTILLSEDKTDKANLTILMCLIQIWQWKRLMDSHFFDIDIDVNTVCIVQTEFHLLFLDITISANLILHIFC